MPATSTWHSPSTRGSSIGLPAWTSASRGSLRAQNLRWIMIHMIEEYARHLGHADLIREAIDGTTG